MGLKEKENEKIILQITASANKAKENVPETSVGRQINQELLNISLDNTEFNSLRSLQQDNSHVPPASTRGDSDTADYLDTDVEQSCDGQSNCYSRQVAIDNGNGEHLEELGTTEVCSGEEDVMYEKDCELKVDAPKEPASSSVAVDNQYSSLVLSNNSVESPPQEDASTDPAESTKPIPYTRPDCKESDPADSIKSPVESNEPETPGAKNKPTPRVPGPTSKTSAPQHSRKTGSVWSFSYDDFSSKEGSPSATDCHACVSLSVMAIICSLLMLLLSLLFQYMICRQKVAVTAAPSNTSLTCWYVNGTHTAPYICDKQERQSLEGSFLYSAFVEGKNECTMLFSSNLKSQLTKSCWLKNSTHTSYVCSKKKRTQPVQGRPSLSQSKDSAQVERVQVEELSVTANSSGECVVLPNPTCDAIDLVLPTESSHPEALTVHINSSLECAAFHLRPACDPAEDPTLTSSTEPVAKHTDPVCDICEDPATQKDCIADRVQGSGSIKDQSSLGRSTHASSAIVQSEEELPFLGDWVTKPAGVCCPDPESIHIVPPTSGSVNTRQQRKKEKPEGKKQLERDKLTRQQRKKEKKERNKQLERDELDQVSLPKASFAGSVLASLRSNAQKVVMFLRNVYHTLGLSMLQLRLFCIRPFFLLIGKIEHVSKPLVVLLILCYWCQPSKAASNSDDQTPETYDTDTLLALLGVVLMLLVVVIHVLHWWMFNLVPKSPPSQPSSSTPRHSSVLDDCEVDEASCENLGGSSSPSFDQNSDTESTLPECTPSESLDYTEEEVLHIENRPGSVISKSLGSVRSTSTEQVTPSSQTEQPSDSSFDESVVDQLDTLTLDNNTVLSAQDAVKLSVRTDCIQPAQLLSTEPQPEDEPIPTSHIHAQEEEIEEPALEGVSSIPLAALGGPSESVTNGQSQAPYAEQLNLPMMESHTELIEEESIELEEESPTVSVQPTQLDLKQRREMENPSEQPKVSRYDSQLSSPFSGTSGVDRSKSVNSVPMCSPLQPINGGRMTGVVVTDVVGNSDTLDQPPKSSDNKRTQADDPHIPNMKSVHGSDPPEMLKKHLPVETQEHPSLKLPSRIDPPQSIDESKPDGISGGLATSDSTSLQSSQKDGKDIEGDGICSSDSQTTSGPMVNLQPSQEDSNSDVGGEGMSNGLVTSGPIVGLQSSQEDNSKDIEGDCVNTAKLINIPQSSHSTQLKQDAGGGGGQHQNSNIEIDKDQSVAADHSPSARTKEKDSKGGTQGSCSSKEVLSHSSPCEYSSCAPPDHQSVRVGPLNQTTQSLPRTDEDWNQKGTHQAALTPPANSGHSSTTGDMIENDLSKVEHTGIVKVKDPPPGNIGNGHSIPSPINPEQSGPTFDVDQFDQELPRLIENTGGSAPLTVDELNSTEPIIPRNPLDDPNEQPFSIVQDSEVDIQPTVESFHGSQSTSDATISEHSDLASQSLSIPLEPDSNIAHSPSIEDPGGQSEVLSSGVYSQEDSHAPPDSAWILQDTETGTIDPLQEFAPIQQDTEPSTNGSPWVSPSGACASAVFTAAHNGGSTTSQAPSPESNPFAAPPKVLNNIPVYPIQPPTSSGREETDQENNTKLVMRRRSYSQVLNDGVNDNRMEDLSPGAQNGDEPDGAAAAVTVTPPNAQAHSIGHATLACEEENHPHEVVVAVQQNEWALHCPQPVLHAVPGHAQYNQNGANTATVNGQTQGSSQHEPTVIGVSHNLGDGSSTRSLNTVTEEQQVGVIELEPTVPVPAVLLPLPPVHIHMVPPVPPLVIVPFPVPVQEVDGNMDGELHPADETIIVEYDNETIFHGLRPQYSHRYRDRARR